MKLFLSFKLYVLIWACVHQWVCINLNLCVKEARFVTWWNALCGLNKRRFVFTFLAGMIVTSWDGYNWVETTMGCDTSGNPYQQCCRQQG